MTLQTWNTPTDLPCWCVVPLWPNYWCLTPPPFLSISRIFCRFWDCPPWWCISAFPIPSTKVAVRQCTPPLGMGSSWDFRQNRNTPQSNTSQLLQRQALSICGNTKDWGSPDRQSPPRSAPWSIVAPAMAKYWRWASQTGHISGPSAKISTSIGRCARVDRRGRILSY